jgi:mono/diheme cytochrome c family protein
MIHRMKLSALVAVAAAVVVGGALATHPVSAQGTAPSGDAARGKALFAANQCISCHGSVGQGNRFSGPELAPHPVSYAAFIKQLRSPARDMPPYSTNLVSDQQAADIYAYLQSIPGGKPASQIPLLSSVDTGNAGPAPKAAARGNVAHGKAIFAENCAACHGANATGGVGPSLIGEKSRKDLPAAIGFIKSPQAPMPALYPSKLSEQDVADVAAYVESL